MHSSCEYKNLPTFDIFMCHLKIHNDSHNDQTLKDQVKEQHHCYDIKMIISIYMEKQHPEEVGKALLMTSPRECIGGQGLIVRFLLDKSGLVLRLNMIAKLNLTLVRSELDGFFLIDGMCTFQNSIAHLQCHMHQSVNSSQPTVWLGGQVARVLDLRSVGRGFKIRLPCCQVQPQASCLHICASVSKQYNWYQPVGGDVMWLARSRRELSLLDPVPISR